MRRFVTLPLFFALFFCTEIVAQTPATVMRDNGQPRALYTNVGFEESVLLKPDGPCSIVALEIYFGSETPGSDTIWIVGDPAEGTVPPTSWVWSYNTLIPPFIVEHDGTPGWKSYDLSTSGLRADGHDRIVVQHRIDAGGPTFVFDNTAQGAPYGSFIMNPGVNNSLGFPGQFSLAQGDFMVRLKVLYDFPEGDGSAGPPIPTMVDVTEEANLVDAAGELTRSSRVGVVDVDADGFDDIVAGGRFWHNQADGTFELVELGISASTSAWADYDNDGDLDLAYLNYNGGLNVFRNNTTDNRSIKIQLQGAPSNSYGIGAVVRIESATAMDTAIDTFLADPTDDSMQAARDAWLRPGGTLIPAGFELFLAIVVMRLGASSS